MQSPEEAGARLALAKAQELCRAAAEGGSSDSAAAPASQTHHYTQTIKRTDMNIDTYNEIIMEIDLTAYTALPASSLEVETLSDGRSIQVLITRTAVDCLTWEIDSNDKKRNIKLLKKENLSQVLSEFQNLLSKSGVKSITSRRVVR